MAAGTAPAPDPQGVRTLGVTGRRQLGTCEQGQANGTQRGTWEAKRGDDPKIVAPRRSCNSSQSATEFLQEPTDHRAKCQKYHRQQRQGGWLHADARRRRLSRNGARKRLG